MNAPNVRILAENETHRENAQMRNVLRALVENPSENDDWECVRASDLDRARELLTVLGEIRSREREAPDQQS